MVKPGIVPRVQRLFFSGFYNLTFLVALVYQMVGLLPPGHPYTNPANKGKFTVSQVIAAAARNLVFSRKNSDQIVMFCAVLLGFLILAGFFVSLLLYVLVGTAFAWSIPGVPAGFSFITPNPTDDVALTLLDMVFGIPGIFHSGAAIPTPFHRGLQFLFSFYATAIFYVAVLIFLYYIASVVTEVALTGQPFGQRFHAIWSPLRLVLAMGLLIPTSGGLTTAQYIVLYTAKYSSGLATNAWIAYNKNLSNPLGVENNKLIAIPKPQDHTDLVKHLFLASVCKEAYKTKGINISIKPYFVTDFNKYKEMDDFDVWAQYDAALAFYKNNDIVIRIGQRNEANFIDVAKGAVFPFCGEFVVPVTNLTPEAKMNQRGSLFAMMLMLEDVFASEFDDLAYRFVNAYTNLTDAPCKDEVGDCAPLDPKEFSEKIKDYNEVAEIWRDEAIRELEKSTAFDMTDDIMKLGWGGAGVWYNKIAERNGALVESMYAVGYMSKYPFVMEQVMMEKAKKGNKFDHVERFNPKVGGTGQEELEGLYDPQLAELFYNVYKYLYQEAGPVDPTKKENEPTDNVFIDMVNMVFGTDAMFSVRDNANAEIHPMAQLVAIGKGILEASIRNYAIGTGSAALGGLSSVLGNQQIGQGITMLSGVASRMASVTIAIGVMLFYVLPFLPFMYFFFAVGTWIKSVFEGILGAPLWALAHLKIDGDGLLPQTVTSGYQLLVEIFIRPLLTVVGLLAGLNVFAAMAVVLNSIFNLVIVNVTGFERSTAGGIEEQVLRGTVDQFFYTIIYVVILYIMANSAFKLIDLIPDHITRWLAADVPSLADKEGDPLEGTNMYAAMGVSETVPQVMGQISSLSGRLGLAAGHAIKGTSPDPSIDLPAPQASPGIIGSILGR